MRLLAGYASLLLLMTGTTGAYGADLVERLDPALDAIVPPDAKLEKLASGFTWTEGPVWIKTGYLLFAEIPSNTIRKWVPGGEASVFLHPSGYKGAEPYGGPEPGSNGMTLDPRGRLVVAGHALRSVWRMETLDPHGSITVLADSFEGKPLNSPNDVVFAHDGALYFTDPPYGLRTQGDQDPEKKLTFNGVYRLPGAASRKAGSAPDGKNLQLVIRDLPRPNGVALSPDGKTLYIANSGPRFWMRYRVQADGSVSDGKKFADVETDARQGAPDGMKLDEKGNLYSTGPGGIWIFSPEGAHLGTILIPEKAANVAWGDADHKTLYITASRSLYRIRLKVTGQRL